MFITMRTRWRIGGLERSITALWRPLLILFTSHRVNHDDESGEHGNTGQNHQT